MGWFIPDCERVYLRTLAQRQAEYTALPCMAARKQMWYDLNDNHSGSLPPVVIETWTFDRDFFPLNIFQCSSEVGRSIEIQLLRNLRNHELINDDKVIPDTFDIGWFTEENEFGVSIGMEQRKDSQGVETGYSYLHPIHNLEKDFSLLKPATFKVDRQKTLDWQTFLTEFLGEFLPVEIRTGFPASMMLTNRVIMLMGMEAFFLAMHDQPEAVHNLMAYLRDNALTWQHWMESENLLRLNNGNQDSFGSSYNFTKALPQQDYTGRVRLKDMWASSNSQETVGISPRMFREFCFPYYIAICEAVGLVYYGCCEPVHGFWNEISQIPHLKKVSISRWCNQQFMGEALRGSGIVFSRKPDPNFLSLDDHLNEDAWAAHIRETLEAARGNFVEFIIRDVYTVHGNLGNARRAVDVAREVIDRFYQP
jgi:hypothetical protein